MKRFALALIPVLFPATVFAQAPACEPFRLVALDGRVVVNHDVGEEGPSLGDVRVGERVIGDGDGKPLGEVRWQITVLDPDHGGKPSHNLVRMFFLFENGSILADGIYTRQGEMRETDGGTARRTELAVLGGTGAFRQARGTIDMLSGIGGVRENVQFEVNASCD